MAPLVVHCLPHQLPGSGLLMMTRVGSPVPHAMELSLCLTSPRSPLLSWLLYQAIADLSMVHISLCCPLVSYELFRFNQISTGLRRMRCWCLCHLTGRRDCGTHLVAAVCERSVTGAAAELSAAGSTPTTTTLWPYPCSLYTIIHSTWCE